MYVHIYIYIYIYIIICRQLNTLTSLSAHPASLILPRITHLELQFIALAQSSGKDLLPIYSLRIGRGRYNPDASDHSLYLPVVKLA